MRIAQIAPLYESVPPKLYGGTERIVSYLTEELVAMGHDVTLFASGDSLTSATLVPCVPTAIRLTPSIKDPLVYHLLMFDRVMRMADQFDILHFHTDYLHFPIFRSMAGRLLTTLHGRLDLPDLQPIYAEFQEMRMVSISDDQRKPLNANWAATVHHGLPETILPFSDDGDGYLAFIGRFSPEKRADRAIEIAIRANMPIKLAAKVDKADEEYFKTTIEPLLDHPLVEYIGEINEQQKAAFLGRAAALLFPIDWPEPFGLVMIEAMACGTPVIAWPHGSVAEVIDEGESGFLVSSIEQAVAAVPVAVAHDRARVRRCFERCFTARRMAQDYVSLYEDALRRETGSAALTRQGGFRTLGLTPLAATPTNDMTLAAMPAKRVLMQKP